MTDFLKLFLVSMFSKITPEEVEKIYNLQSVNNRWKEDKRMKFFSQIVTQKALDITPYVNNDKINLLSALFLDEWGKQPKSTLNNTSPCINPFYTLLHFSNKCMKLVHDFPVAKFSCLLELREISEIIGEDIIACSLAAYNNRNEKTTLYIPEISSPSCGNDADLLLLFNKGLPDLHQHLYASCDTFTLSWICLMNHITQRTKIFRELFSNIAFNKEKSANQLYLHIYEAAKIRINLYREIRGLDQIPFKKSIAYYRNIQELQQYINIQRLKDKGRGKNNYAILDYAFVPSLGKNSYHPLNGEVYILYQTLKKIYAHPQDTKLTENFYKYVLIKNILRKELIQNNERTGFGNFSIFEKRKDLFIEKYPQYDNLKIEMSLQDAYTNHHVSYIETRIAPKCDFKKFQTQYHRIQKISSKLNITPKLIYHFIKRQDDKFVILMPRHETLRREIKLQAINIINFTNSNISACQNIIGIDAANSELATRPEVFAQSYRYLRYHSCPQKHLLFPLKKAEEIHFTFHVGEDFYDLADGLRAIDECIQFLHMQDGDRLGHCLALGINARNYYILQNNAVIIPKQWLMDNCAWIIQKAQSLNIVLASNLKMELTNKFNELSIEIYGKVIDYNEYLLAMQLRGDNPRLYPLNNKDIRPVCIGDWHSFDFEESLQARISRQSKEACKLYYRYHYDRDVRKNGDKVEVFHVTEPYKDAIEKIQEGMMNELEKRGIVIEACPTSNLKIGTQKRFDELPLLRFLPPSQNKLGHHLRVTINTDDLGIFSTALDYEYAILAAAALKAKDDKGREKYTRLQILNWLEEIRGNGFKYMFSHDVDKHL